MNPDNRWVRKAEAIPWNDIEDRYAELFPSQTGMPAKPLRMALGSLIIQKQYGYSDRELVEQIMENPYYQYFVGLPGFQEEQPYAPSLLVEFRKRLTEEILGEINEMIIAYNHPKDHTPKGDGDNSAHQSDSDKEAPNSGTLVLDATCAPQYIAFPQDINLLNEAREKLEEIIDTICYEYNESSPRTYRRNARKDDLSLAKRRKRTARLIRKAIKKQEYTDAVDRIGVERAFSLAKRSYSLGLIRTKLDTTTRSSIVLSIIARNIDRLAAFSLYEFLKSIFQGSEPGKICFLVLKTA